MKCCEYKGCILAGYKPMTILTLSFKIKACPLLMMVAYFSYIISSVGDPDPDPDP